MMDIESIVTVKQLHTAYQKVAENNGCAGIDGVSVQTFGKNLPDKLAKLHSEVISGNYQCQPCKNITIPKNTGAFRILAIPTVRDRILQTAISQKLVPFFEPHFEKCSFGYRPERSYLQAVKLICKYRDQGYYHVLDADIKGYFDHIPHALLINEFNRYIQCPKLTDLINRSLMQMQTKQGQCVYGQKFGLGLPQGSPLSPVLANMYLDPLDEILLSHHCKVIRYADDFIVMGKQQKDVAHALLLAKECLTTLALSFNGDKTRVTDFDSGFVFLGHYFVGQLCQPIKTDTTPLPLVSWQWDAPSMHSNEQTHAFSGKTIDKSEYHNETIASHHSLQNAIWDIQQVNHQALTHEALTHKTLAHNQQHPRGNNTSAENQSALVNKLRTLYVSQQGAVIHKIAGKFDIRFAGESQQQVPITQIEAIFCFGNIHITRAVIIHAFEQEISLIMLSQMGNWLGIINQQQVPNLDIIQCRQQLELNQQLDLAKAIVTSKVNQCITLLKRRMRYLNTSEQLNLSLLLKRMQQTKQQIKAASNINKLRGYEGYSAKLYFVALRKLIDPKWQFHHRNRRPPKDPVNALLSLGYTMLYNNVLAMANLRNIPVNLGVLHVNNKLPTLILDTMESFRAQLVDSTVLKLIASRAISPDDFKHENHGCYLTKRAKTAFIAALEQAFSRQVHYPAFNVTSDYRRIIDLQLLAYCQHLKDPKQAFKPFQAR